MSTTEIILLTLLALCGSGLVVTTIILPIRIKKRRARGQAVYQYRSELLMRILVAANIDILLGRFSEWRFAVLNSVTWDEMVKSKRPLESFYPDLSFLDPTATDPNAK